MSARVLTSLRPGSAPPTPSSRWAYFLDFDGTLVELAESPGAARVDSCVRDILSLLVSSTHGAVALVSGRAIQDLRDRFRFDALPMAGQHGAERRDASGAVHESDVAPGELDAARERLARLLHTHPTLLLEDKGRSLAVHYRRSPALASPVRAAMREALALVDERFAITEGKCVVELRLRHRDKGVAIAEFMQEAPFRDRRPVFIGDDRTDEAGFAMINAMFGISVKVGPGATVAQWRLPNVDAVRHWLRQVEVRDGTEGAAHGG